MFLSSLGLTAFVAVVSYWWQYPGLAGPNGIAPLEDTAAGLSQVTFFELPTLLHVSSSNGFVHLLLGLATLSSIALIVGIAPRWAALTLWATWGSIVQLGYPFLAFQWDLLLMEAAFCAALFSPIALRLGLDDEPEPHFAFRLLMAALACKVTLESGLVKVMGGDPSWRDLTALTYHWWSQPLPTWTSVFIARAAMFLQQAMCALMFVLELVFPLLVFGPRRVRLVGAIGLIALQLGLMAAGNYSFYNLLTLVLALPMLDDAFVAWFRRGETVSPLPDPLPREGRGRQVGAWIVLLAYVSLSVAFFLRLGSDSSLLRTVRRFNTLNAYGAFARMTKTRPEILIEGSTDGVTWEPWIFPHKPVALDRRPGFIAPWQPRLDWQMWFAALGDCSNNPWVLTLQQRLLAGTPEVRALFDSGPAKSRFARTRVFEYRFAPPGSNDWWVRTETGAYCPEVMLAPDGALLRAAY